MNIPKMLKVFFACRIVLAASHQYPGYIQRLFRLHKCLGSKSSKSRKYSKTYWPAELSQPHVISIPKNFEDVFACRIVLTANHQYPGNIQRLFHLQNCLSCKSSVSRNIRRLLRLQKCLSRQSSISRKHSKTLCLQNCLGWKSSVSRKIQRLFRRQSCLSRKSSISRKRSKSFSHAELSQPQIINIPKTLKDFFACRIVFAANHQNPGNIQRVIGLLNCLSPMSSVFRKYSQTSSPAELSQQQIIDIPELLKDFFACRTVLAAGHQYPGKFQRLFRLPSCLSNKSLISRKDSKTFLACRIILDSNHQYPENTQRFIGLLNCLSPMSSVSREYSKTSSPAELSQQQIINIPEIFKDFFACRTVLAGSHRFPEIFKDIFAGRVVVAATHQYRESTQSLFRMQNCLSRKSSISRKNSKTFRPQNCLSRK